MSTDAEYYDRRAERQLELELAQLSAHPAAIAAHCAIADRYMELRSEAEADEIAE